MRYIIILFIVFNSCEVSRLPTHRLKQSGLEINYEFIVEELTVSIKNPLHCPVRVWIQSQDSILESYFSEINPITLEPLKDSILTVEDANFQTKELHFRAQIGDPNQKIRLGKVNLPFQKNKAYRLIQGYDSQPTHNTDWSRYAFDFGLEIGDTVCAATKGYVVGVIEGYEFGGEGSEWNDYGNFITIFDPESGLYTQYVHLEHNGSLVELGEWVTQGKAIGISGMTGQTNIEHLHFNCLIPDQSEKGLMSIPIDSIGIYITSELKRNELLKNYN